MEFIEEIEIEVEEALKRANKDSRRELNDLLDKVYALLNKINNEEYIPISNKLYDLVEKSLSSDQDDSDEISKLGIQKEEIRVNKLYRLQDLTHKIIQKIHECDLLFVNEDDEISLYKGNNGLVSSYSIFLKGTSTEIGKMGYYGTGLSTGDVSYSIYPNYQGHGYAYKALCLLSDHLYENGINEFIIMAEKNNIPSVKTIAKYGGEIIDSEPNILACCCLTRKLEKKNKNS